MLDNFVQWSNRCLLKNVFIKINISWSHYFWIIITLLINYQNKLAQTFVMMWTVNDGNDSVYRIVNTIAGIVWHIFDIISDENNKNDRKYNYKQLTQKQISFDQIDEE